MKLQCGLPVAAFAGGQGWPGAVYAHPAAQDPPAAGAYIVAAAVSGVLVLGIWWLARRYEARGAQPARRS